MDWSAKVLGVAKSRTRLKRLGMQPKERAHEKGKRQKESSLAAERGY